MLYLHRITNSIDVGHGGLHPVIDQNATLQAKRQTGIFSKAGFRGDTNGKHHHIRMDSWLIFQQHIDTTVFLFKALHTIAKCQFYTVLANLAVDKGSHICIKGIHQLFRPLDDGHIHTQFP